MQRSYYYAGAARIAMRVTYETVNEVYYILTDHLGSTSLAYRTSDVQTTPQYYKPWGEVRQLTGELPTDRTFQGQRVSGWGLTHFGARWFDSALGRFAQADTIVPGAKNPIAWDRFAGLGNNPVKYTDPSGHDPYCSIYTDYGQCAKWTDNRPVRNNPSKPFFFQLPVSKDNLEGVQWFGATQRSYDLWEEGDSVYAYCQGMHCGLDLLAAYGTSVYAGVYGEVIKVYIVETGMSEHEGPYKIMIVIDNYVITYGHTNGVSYVKEGQFVTPDTVISSVGNMGGSKGSGEIDHIHLEIRGPGGWDGGLSQNPLRYMGDEDVAVLVDVAKKQEIQIEMSRFGSSGKEYPPLSKYMPNSIERTFASNFWE